jgi:uncharacterized protein DUF4350
MPRGLDSADRKLLIAAGALLVALLVASAIVAPAQVPGSSSIPSSYSAAWDGSKAAFLLLQELGYDVEHWERSPQEITKDAAKTVLILAEPIEPPSEDEQAALREFVLQGGRVVTTGANAYRYLPMGPTSKQGDEFEEQKTFPALLPSPLVQGAPKITMTAPAGWHPDTPSQLVVYGDDETAVVITYRFGNGTVVWWAAATPLINQTIREPGNMAFFLNCVAPPQGGRVLWDEYFHGAHASLWTYFSRTPLPAGLAQCGLVFVAVIFTFSRRQGPVRAPATVTRLSPLEFVETLGDLYHSAHAGPAAVRITLQRFRFMLTRQLGMANDVSAEELARAAAQGIGWKEQPLLDLLQRAEQAGRLAIVEDKESREIVQQLFDCIAQLEVKRVSKQETHPA